MAPERIESGEGEHMSGAKRRKKISFPSTFSALQVRLVVLVSAFMMGNGLVSLLLAVLLTVPPRTHPFVKVGARAPGPCGVGASELYAQYTCKN